MNEIDKEPIEFSELGCPPDHDDPSLVPEIRPKGRVRFPDGWALFGGQDDRVRLGLETDQSVIALSGAAWLEQPIGSPSIFSEAVTERGALEFDGRIDYLRALFALYQSVNLVGRLPTPAADEALRAIGVRPAAVARYIRKEDPDAPHKTVVFTRERDRVLLGLTAPFTWQPDSGAVYFPTYAMPACTTIGAVEVLVERARRVNRILPFTGGLARPLLDPVHVLGVNQ